MIVIVLVQQQAPASVEVKQPLHRLDILDRVMIQLASHLEEHECGGQAPGEHQHTRQHEHVPQR